LKLVNGITGFFNSPDNEPPNVDVKQFKKICFTIIQQYKGKVLDFKEPNFTNYYVVDTNVLNKHFYILLNAHYPIMTFAASVEGGYLVFKDEPELSKQFSPFYTVLDSKELNEPPLLNLSSKENISRNENELNSAELYNLAYWKPTRMGEIIFNCWD
jgi:hypothetical protein